MPEKSAFAVRLAQMRVAKGLSQVDLAEQTSLGRSTISRWEADENDPSLVGIVELARFFGCTTDYLAGKTDHPQLLRPGDWLVDLDAHEQIMGDPRNPKASEIVWAAAVPDRYSVVGSAEYLRMKREQDAAYKRGRR
jgi:transcriptional regulator with XRE-family HTH domain